MKIRFLRNCSAPQNYSWYCCEICGHVPAREPRLTEFLAEEEFDPTAYGEEIDLSSLKYKEDYEIIEYP